MRKMDKTIAATMHTLLDGVIKANEKLAGTNRKISLQFGQGTVTLDDYTVEKGNVEIIYTNIALINNENGTESVLKIMGHLMGVLSCED